MTDIPKKVTSNALRPWRAHAIALLLLAAALALAACLGEGDEESAMTDVAVLPQSSDRVIIKEVPVEKVVVQEVPVEKMVDGGSR